MNISDFKPWHCEKGSTHVLGLVRRNGRNSQHLLLFRQAIDDEHLSVEVDVIAILEGRVIDVRCSICEKTRQWVPDAKKDNAVNRYKPE